MEQEARGEAITIGEAIIGVAKEVEKIGSEFPIIVLRQLVESIGARPVERPPEIPWTPIPGGTYTLPIEGRYIIVLDKRRGLRIYFGEENEDRSIIDVSTTVGSEIYRSHGKPTLQRLKRLERIFKSREASTAMQRYEESIRLKKIRWQSRRGKALSRRVRDMGDVAPPQVKSVESSKKAEITEEDFSFYEGSGINFKHLLSSPRPVIKEWTQNLHSYQKNIENKEVYMSQLKELHSKVANYHNIKCEGKPPTSCAWNCDIWKLLHLCLYLMEESDKIR